VSDTGTLRVRWQTRDYDRKETGTFRLTVQSAISGRAVAVAAEQRGSGQGDSSVALDPSPLYILIESKDLDWSFTVEEALDGVVGARPGSTSSEFSPAPCPAVVEHSSSEARTACLPGVPDAPVVRVGVSPEQRRWGWGPTPVNVKIRASSGGERVARGGGAPPQR